MLFALARKYYLSPGGLRCELGHASMWNLRGGYYAQAVGVTIEIALERAELLLRALTRAPRQAIPAPSNTVVAGSGMTRKVQSSVVISRPVPPTVTESMSGPAEVGARLVAVEVEAALVVCVQRDEDERGDSKRCHA